jgi:predicted metal-dependent hydrolase
VTASQLDAAGIDRTRKRQRRRPPIEPRNRRFAVRGERMASWHSENLYISHFFNALSLMFPEGERFFVDSVRRVRHRIMDPDLQAQMEAFIRQEAIHAREHLHYNDELRRQGYPTDVFDLLTRIALRSTRLTPARWQLAITCAFEHFTATLADAALRDAEVLGDAAADYAELWRWHSAEEIEHKAVAFDVYQSVAPGVLGYLTRVAAMAVVSANYLPYVMVQQLALAAVDRVLLDPGAAAGALRFFWTRPGLISRQLKMYLDYYKPTFHPWEHDNADLFWRWRQTSDPAS